MKTGISVKWMLLILLGLNLLETQPVTATELVNYTPGPPFTFNAVGGNSNQDFGTVNIQSDNSSGWVLKVRSLNHSALKHSSSSYTVNYMLTVDGSSADLSGSNDFTVKTANTPTCNQPSGCNFSVQGTISEGASEGKPAGAYTDTLIFTLTTP